MRHNSNFNKLAAVNKYFQVLNYSETLRYLFSRLPMFQRVGPAAYKQDLDNTVRLLRFYGDPHRKMRAIHVAGTNGKGSVSHMLAAVFQSAGYKTGLYTSPHLRDFRERIRINGKMIPKAEVVEWLNAYRTGNERWKITPSFFELTVAMAFDYFARQRVDIALIETGLGGRLDSTNVVYPELSIITNIGMDHTALLGDSLEKIAREKAGIIKPGVPVVVGESQKETNPVFTEIASRLKAPLFFADREFSVTFGLMNMEGNQVMAVEKNNEKYFSGLTLDLKGLYQQRNLPAVLKSLELMQAGGWKISRQNIFDGLANTAAITGLEGRWQVLGSNPAVVCDTAHNREGVAAVVEQIKNTPFKQLHMVFGLVNDKDAEALLELLPRDAVYYFTKASIPRALDEKVLAEKGWQLGMKGNSYSSVKEAFDEAKKNAGENDFIFIGGSTFVVAEIL